MKSALITTTLLVLAIGLYLPFNAAKNDSLAIYQPAEKAPMPTGQILLPIEVLGEEGKIVERTFEIDNTTFQNTSRIWLMINNLSYENKGSVKINDNNWIPLNHQSTDIQTQEKQLGGMVHGGFNTIRLTIPSDGLQSGANTIKFRFNASDGISIGYRVVRMNLTTANGDKLLPLSYFELEDPSTWTPPYSDPTSIAEGKDLWYNANLWNHYLDNNRNGDWYGQTLPSSRPMKANCTSCHTQDGRDLEIFSYSNTSIVERAKFHKLTEEQGKKIASYIRSLSSTEPKVERYGRPWNPPYQPGPVLENKPIEQWAAGAGIDAVLEEDKDMLPYLFGNTLTKQAVYDYFDSNNMDDRTTLPVAIQFPDWKHWLPIIHPIDAYSKLDGSFPYIEHPNREQKPLTALEDFTNWINGASETEIKNRFISKHRDCYEHFRNFLAEGANPRRHWRSDNGLALSHLAPDVPKEIAATSLARLLAVKNFEVMNEYNLQDKAQWFTNPSDQPGDRQWPTRKYNVFEVPPHFNACISGDSNCNNFVGQPRTTGRYESTAWYHLQFVLNGGNGLVGGTTPTDFNYNAQFIAKAMVTSDIPEPLRYYSAINQMYQIRNWSGNSGPHDESGYRIRNQGPFQYIGIHDNNTFWYTNPETILLHLDAIDPGTPLSKWVLEALLLQFLDEMNKPKNNVNDWDRADDAWSGKSIEYMLDKKSKTTSEIRDISTGLFRAEYADKMYYSLAKFIALGVDCSIINQVSDWCKSAWPNIDFEKFKADCINFNPCTTTSINTGNTYHIKTKHHKCISAISSGGYSITQQLCEDSADTKWMLEAANSGYYFIKNMETSNYMQTTGPNNGDAIKEAAFTGTTNQQWDFVVTDNCKYNIKPRGIDKCIDLKSGLNVNGNHFQLWSCALNGQENRAFTFELLTTLSINTPEKSDSLKVLIYPNPANTLINIKYENGYNSDAKHVILYDVVGRRLKELITTKERMTINIENIPSGHYIIKMVSNKQTTIRKIVIKN